jgi:uncharacterized membrane protein
MSAEIMKIREVMARMKPQETFTTDLSEALEKACAESGEHKSPWFVRALVALSAWLASLMFLLFVYGSNVVSNSSSSIVLGALLVAGAVILRRVSKRVLFLEQLALASSLAGQAMMTFGIGEKMHFATAALSVICMSVALIAFYPDKTHRFLSTVIAVVAAYAYVYDLHTPYGLQLLTAALAMGAGHVWHYESTLLAGAREPLLRPVAYGLIVGMFFLLIPSGLPPDLRVHLRDTQNWIPATLALAALLMLLEYRLLSFHGSLGRIRITVLVLIGTIALTVASLKAPGIIGALYVLAIGFHRGNRIIMGIAFTFLTLFLAAYYYNMEITLLTKSYTLLAAGAVLLMLRPFLTGVLQNKDEEVRHE